VNEPDRIREALEKAETVAVVGCSPDPSRASYTIARYLLSQGYRVVPVNPGHEELLGQKCYPSLSDIPADVRVDIVDVFRRSEHVAEIARETIARGVPFVFLQKGVIDPEAARKLEEAGIGVAMDRCILVEHERHGIVPKSRNAAPRGGVSSLSRTGTQH
jgi:predicted CoA-binding protein